MGRDAGGSKLRRVECDGEAGLEAAGQVSPGDALDRRDLGHDLAPRDRGDLLEVVARLEGIGTVASRFTITPFVGFLPGRPLLTPDPREVVRVFEVPLSELMADGVFREERWDTWRNDLDIHFYELVDETVWGATARILTGFLAHLIDAR